MSVRMQEKETRIIIPRISDLKLYKGYIQATKVWKFVLEKHETVFWPNMNAKVRGQMSQCSICSEFQAKNPKEPAQSHHIPERPCSRVAAEQFSLLGEDYIVLVDF